MAAETPSYAHDVVEAMLALMSGDNGAMKAAEAFLTDVIKEPASMLLLLELLATHENVQVRQLSAVLMQKRILRHWNRLSVEQREHIKTQLLHVLASEPVKIVRLNAGNVVSHMARVELANENWNELPQFLNEQCAHANGELRESGARVLATVIEAHGQLFMPFFHNIVQVIATLLHDEFPRVREAALMVVSALIQYLEMEHAPLFREALVTPAITALEGALQNLNQDFLVRVLDMMEELVESPVPVLGNMYAGAVHFLLRAASISDLDALLRHQALDVVVSICTNKPKVVRRLELAKPIVETLCDIACTPDEDEEDAHADDEDAQFTATSNVACQMIDAVSMYYSAGEVFGYAIPKINAYLNSPGTTQRRGALHLLGVLSEACCDHIRPELSAVASYVLQCAVDESVEVRSAAFVCLTEFSQWLFPDILDFYDQVVPVFLNALKDPSEKVTERVLLALDVFVDHLEEEQVAPFLEPLVSSIVHLLATGAQKTTTQESALGTLASTISAAGASIQPFMGSFVDMLRTLLMQEAPDVLSLRGRALHTMGTLAVAVGTETFAPLLEETMESAFKGFELSDPELSEFTYHFFITLSPLYTIELVEVARRVVEYIGLSIDRRDIMFGDEDDEEGLLSNNGDDVTKSIRVRTSFMAEKAAAIQCYGAFAEHCAAAIMSESLAVFMGRFSNSLRYFHEEVRAQTACTLVQICIGVSDLLQATLASPQQLNELRKQLIDGVVPSLLMMVSVDDDRETVSKYLEELSKGIVRLEGAFIADHLPAVAKALKDVFEQRVPSLTTLDDAEFNDDADGSGRVTKHHDFFVLEAAADVFTNMARVCGAAWAPHVAELLPIILEYAHQSDDSQIMAFAVTGELCSHFQGLMTDVAEGVLNAATPALASHNVDVRRNAVFTIGQLCEFVPALQAYYGKLLEAIAPLLQQPPNTDRDNAAAAVARMLYTAPNCVPKEAVLPLWLSALPLKHDMDEVGAVCKALITIVDDASHVPDLIPCAMSTFAEALSINNDGANAAAQSGLQKYVAVHADAVRGALQQLPDESTRVGMLNLAFGAH